MKEAVQRVLSGISEARQNKYNAEVERQKTGIESELMKFLDAKKAEYEAMDRATVNEQNANSMKFSVTLDAVILPEVADYISKELGLTVDTSDSKKAVGTFEA